jgi:small subunit ribosomal protein S18
MNPIHPMQTGTGFKPNNKRVIKKKVNPMKDSRVVDYLDPKFLGRFTNDQGKILPRRITGINAFQQREIAKAIKYARHLALVPFVANDVA